MEVEGPAFAESITEGDIRWIKRRLLRRVSIPCLEQGDFVEVDELVAEIETDKVRMGEKSFNF